MFLINKKYKKILVFSSILLLSSISQSCSNIPNLSSGDCQTLMKYKMDNIDEFKIKHHTPEHIEMVETALKNNNPTECGRVLDIIN